MSESADQCLELRLLRPIAAAEIDSVRRQLHRLRSAARGGDAPRAFLIVTPLGMSRRAEIETALSGAGIVLAGRTVINDWPRCSTFVYPRTDDDERLRVAIVFEKAWRAIGLSQRGERWELARVSDLDRLTRLKAGWRARFGTVRVRVVAPDVSIPTPNQAIRLQAFHLPEPAAASYEWQMLEGALSYLAGDFAVPHQSCEP